MRKLAKITNLLREGIIYCNFVDVKFGCSVFDMYLKLFTTFFKIGAFTFGGGWAMISIIEREIVDRRHWIDREEFLDLLAVAQSLPGILAVNISVAVGDKIKGVKGSVVSALGTILPSFMMILAIAIFLTPEVIKSNATVTAIFKGIRPAGGGVCLKLTPGAGGTCGRHYVADGVDPRCCCIAYMVEMAGGVKSYIVHIPWRGVRLYVVCPSASSNARIRGRKE